MRIHVYAKKLNFAYCFSYKFFLKIKGKQYMCNALTSYYMPFACKLRNSRRSRRLSKNADVSDVSRFVFFHLTITCTISQRMLNWTEGLLNNNNSNNKSLTDEQRATQSKKIRYKQYTRFLHFFHDFFNDLHGSFSMTTRHLATVYHFLLLYNKSESEYIRNIKFCQLQVIHPIY